MNTELKKELLSYFDGLPKETQQSFLSLDLDSFFYETQETKPLEGWQRNILKDQITLVFLGLSDPVMLSTNITHGVEVSRDRAEKITRLIKQKVLIPNKPFIKSAQDTTNDEPVEGGVLENHPASTDGIVHNNIPIPVKPTKKRTLPERIENVEQQIKKEQVGTLDVFKKRLTSPVHTPAKEEEMSETSSETKKKVANTSPSSPEQLENDPYKESVE